MRALIVLLLLMPSVAFAAETRCGWFQNPTPANAWLIDKDGQWIIGVQGGYQSEGDWPDTGEWVAQNGNYGYGCTCARVETDAASGHILNVLSSKPLPLSKCRNDPALAGKEPG